MKAGIRKAVAVDMEVAKALHRRHLSRSRGAFRPNTHRRNHLRARRDSARSHYRLQCRKGRANFQGGRETGEDCAQGRLATDKCLRGVLAFWASYESNCITGTLIFMDAVCTLTEDNYPPRWVQDG